MSLKHFHVVFISASALVAFLFAVWCLTAPAGEPLGGGRIAAAVCSVLAGIGLCVYESWFLRKMPPRMDQSASGGKRGVS
jgi:hypothetical protein